AADADLLLHVVDASDPAWEQHVATTEALLAELDLAALPRVLVMNKIDRIEPPERRRIALGHRDAVLVSGVDRATLAPLLEVVMCRIGQKGAAAKAEPALA